MDALVLAAVVWAIGYTLLCVWWPYAACGNCDGAGKFRSPRDGPGGRVAAAAGSGRRVRTGRRVVEWFPLGLTPQGDPTTSKWEGRSGLMSLRDWIPVPDSWLEPPDNLTPQQERDYTQWYDEQVRKLRAGPGGKRAAQQFIDAEHARYKAWRRSATR